MKARQGSFEQYWLLICLQQRRDPPHALRHRSSQLAHRPPAQTVVRQVGSQCCLERASGICHKISRICSEFLRWTKVALRFGSPRRQSRQYIPCACFQHLSGSSTTSKSWTCRLVAASLAAPCVCRHCADAAKMLPWSVQQPAQTRFLSHA